MENIDYTICVCPRCGAICTAREACPYCGCTMIRTKYVEDDIFETDLDWEQFDNKIRNEYVYGNPLYSDFEFKRRVEKQEVENYSSPPSELRCPNCGSTAVTTGQRGYSAIYGFAGSSRTVNRCGKCGYSWEP